MKYLTENLLNSIKIRAMVPISQATFQDADLTMLANEELQLKLVSDIMEAREDFFLTNQSVAVQANVDTYTMPSRAIGNALKIVWYVDTQGNKKRLVQRDVSETAGYSNTGSGPGGYFIQGDQIVILPAPTSSGGSIRFDFYARPNQLVATSSCAKITGVSTLLGVTTFTVDTDLSASLLVGSTVDIVSMASPFLLWGLNVAITSISSTTIAVSSSGVSDQAGNIEPTIGDYICPSGYANIAQVPQEFHPVLAQMVANRILWGLGDLNKLEKGMETLKEDRANALKLIRNRVEESAKSIIPYRGFVDAFSSRY